MIRTQIQLRPQQERVLRRYAQAKGISLAEAVRRCIDRMLLDDETNDIDIKYKQAAQLIGSLSEKMGATNLSSDHDTYLESAFE
ncbi:MAG: CopG family transcriptional regulator [Myxococcota bacterium]|nr:CopG family transcriptional regulator [Myxococcota bacterium]